MKILRLLTVAFLSLFITSQVFAQSTADGQLTIVKRLNDIYGNQTVSRVDSIDGYTVTDTTSGSTVTAFGVNKAGDPFNFAISANNRSKNFRTGFTYVNDSANIQPRTFNIGIDWLGHYEDIAGTAVNAQQKRVVHNLVFHNVIAKNGSILFLDGTITGNILHRSRNKNGTIKQYSLGTYSIRFTYQSDVLCSDENGVIATLRSEIDELETVNHELAVQVAELEQQSIETTNVLAARDATIESLKASVAAKQTQINNLNFTVSSSTAASEADNKKLKTKLKRVRKKLKRLLKASK